MNVKWRWFKIIKHFSFVSSNWFFLFLLLFSLSISEFLIVFLCYERERERIHEFLHSFLFLFFSCVSVDFVCVFSSWERKSISWFFKTKLFLYQIISLPPGFFFSFSICDVCYVSCLSFDVIICWIYYFCQLI